MADYKEIKSGDSLIGYLRVRDNASIPISTENRDYREFLDLQARGQVTILPPDPVVAPDPRIAAAKTTLANSLATPGARLDALVVLMGLGALTAAPPIQR